MEVARHLELMAEPVEEDRRRILTAPDRAGNIELAALWTRHFGAGAVPGACARRETEIDRMILAGFVLNKVRDADRADLLLTHTN